MDQNAEFHNKLGYQEKYRVRKWMINVRMALFE